MNKRITSILLCFAMIIGVLVAAVPVYADEPSSCTFTFEADKTEANPGDTITFTVYMEQQGGINAFEGTVGIPAGLTYVSGVTADGLKATLGFDDAAWSDDTKYVVSGYGTENYTGEAKLKLATFKCTVDSDAAGTYKVGFVSDPPMVAEYLDEVYNSYNKNPVCNAVEITVASAHTHVFDKTVATDEHKANDADCTHAATYYMSCECGENGTEVFENGTALGHDFSKKSNTYIHTEAANCQQHVEYWYSCSRCEISAEGLDDAKHYSSTVAGEHSFTKKVEDDAHYVAGTGIDCLSVKKYYYNCEYCDEIGTGTWDSEEKGPHSWMTDWTPNGADGHYHKCSTCGEKKDIESHHPDRPAATETEDQRCIECGYLMQEALGHTHHTSRVDRKEATCTADGNKQYYKCECGEWFEDATANVTIDDHSSVVLPATGHDYSVKNSDAAHKRSTAADCRETDTYWYTCANDASHNAKDDAAATDKWYASETAGSHVFDTTKWVDRGNEGHAHKCRYHDAYDGTAAHTPDRDEPDYENDVKCDACGHIMVPRLEDKDVRIELPLKVNVKKTGEMDPTKETFKFAISEIPDVLDCTMVKDTLETEGEKTYTGSFVFTIKESKINYISDGFDFTEVKGSTNGWTYDETVYRVVPEFGDNILSGFRVYRKVGDEYEPVGETILTDDQPGEALVEFTNSYNAQKPTPPTPPTPTDPGDDSGKTPDVPATGDASNPVVWIVLLLVSAAGLVTMAVLIRRRKKAE